MPSKYNSVFADVIPTGVSLFWSELPSNLKLRWLSLQFTPFGVCSNKLFSTNHEYSHSS